MSDMIPVETSIGLVHIRLFGLSDLGCHYVYVDLGHSEYLPDNTKKHHTVTIRGIEYRGDFRLYQWCDGLFHTGPEFLTDSKGGYASPLQPANDWSKQDSRSMWRASQMYMRDGASDTAFNKAQEAVETAVNAYLTPRAYLLDYAECERLQAEIDKADSKIAETELILLGLKVRRLEVQDSLQALETKIGQEV